MFSYRKQIINNHNSLSF